MQTRFVIVNANARHLCSHLTAVVTVRFVLSK
jgi:hypothetical protein